MKHLTLIAVVSAAMAVWNATGAAETAPPGAPRPLFPLAPAGPADYRTPSAARTSRGRGDVPPRPAPGRRPAACPPPAAK